ncbi:hypothetical protein LP421_09905 [Rhizobium sp. RCAM05350]|nr:hypothetical protein LP421_09905 [Rhizobium sp. RCAM05350]
MKDTADRSGYSMIGKVWRGRGQGLFRPVLQKQVGLFDIEHAHVAKIEIVDGRGL